jgi:hypothetical protein
LTLQTEYLEELLVIGNAQNFKIPIYMKHIAFIVQGSHYEMMKMMIDMQIQLDIPDKIENRKLRTYVDLVPLLEYGS